MDKRPHWLCFDHLSALDRVTFFIVVQYQSYIMAEVGEEGMFQDVTLNIET